MTGAAAAPYLAAAGAPADWSARVCVEGEGDIRNMWEAVAPGAEVATPPSAEQVAADLWVETEAQLREPSIATDPPEGTSSIVSLPVFVEVTNWLGEQTPSTCVEGVCVQITATPTLFFDPGEPGVVPLVCDPPGTRYDPDGAEPEVQASAPGASLIQINAGPARPCKGAFLPRAGR